VNFLIDTNVVSEWTKPRPDGAVAAWLAAVDEDRVFLSVVTIAELRHGIERLPAGARSARLGAWLTEVLVPRFDARVLPVDADTADAWGRMMARGRSVGRSVGAMDACIAATAERHDLTLATRNTADFRALGIRLLDPWSRG